jgi:hypothetical protein
MRECSRKVPGSEHEEIGIQKRRAVNVASSGEFSPVGLREIIMSLHPERLSMILASVARKKNIQSDDLLRL